MGMRSVKQIAQAQAGESGKDSPDIILVPGGVDFQSMIPEVVRERMASIDPVEQAKQAKKAKVLRIREKQASLGMVGKQLTNTFSNYHPVSAEQKAGVKLANGWVRDFDPRSQTNRGCILHGQSGTGKSHLEDAMTALLLWKSPSLDLAYLTVTTWMELYTDHYRAGTLGTLNRSLLRKQLIVIDELPHLVRHPNTYARSWFLDLLWDLCRSGQVPLLSTSNHSLKGLSEWEEVDVTLSNRLIELMPVSIYMAGPSGWGVDHDR